MPAQSKQQQKFMGLVHAIQKGDVPASDASPEAQKVAKDMSPSDVKDFASTKHTGLPKRVKQEIIKKLKEYAMTLPGHHSKPAAPMDSLRSDDEMDVQETRIPQNFNVGTTRDYHTKLATTPRKKYDKTNFNPVHSGQEDLEEAQAVSGGKVHKFITGKNLGYKGKKYSQIEFETLGVDNKNGTIRLKILAPKQIFGNEMRLDFRTVRRGPFFKTDTSKVNESSPCWDGYKQVGMKTKGGNQVPNCVKESIDEAKVKVPDYIISNIPASKIEPTRIALADVSLGLKMAEKLKNWTLQKGHYSLVHHNGKVALKLTPKGKLAIKVRSEKNPDYLKLLQTTIDMLLKQHTDKLGKNESVNETSKADIIKDLDKVKNDLLKKVDVLIAKKKKLYSNVDIESPMTADEKKLDRDIADLFSQINKLVLQKRNLKEYGQALDLHFILNKDAKLDGTPEPKKAIGEELSFDEREMVIGIIEILKQVQDPKNRMKIALNMLKKFKEEGIEFDYQKFINHLKEYSMGSYEYDKGSRELGEIIKKIVKESLVIKANNVIPDLLPQNLFTVKDSKSKEKLRKTIEDLISTLNKFYDEHDIDWKLKR